MSHAVSISEAKAQLSKLVSRAERGDEVTIRRGSRPMAKTVGIETPPSFARSPFGALRGQIVVADDFDELGPEWDPYTRASRPGWAPSTAAGRPRE